MPFLDINDEKTKNKLYLSLYIISLIPIIAVVISFNDAYYSFYSIQIGLVLVGTFLIWIFLAIRWRYDFLKIDNLEPGTGPPSMS